MSKKNNLEFDRGQPSFLRRLRGEITGQSDGDPDRHVNPVARPKRAKRLDADEDDGPTYVMEDTNATLTKDEYEILVKDGAKDEQKGEEAVQDDVSLEQKGKVTQKLGTVGHTKKRKLGKVIGGDDEGGEDAAANGEAGDKTIQNGDKKSKGTEKKPAKKKKAKVKIAFGDDEET